MASLRGFITDTFNSVKDKLGATPGQSGSWGNGALEKLRGQPAAPAQPGPANNSGMHGVRADVGAGAGALAAGTAMVPYDATRDPSRAHGPHIPPQAAAPAQAAQPGMLDKLRGMSAKVPTGAKIFGGGAGVMAAGAEMLNPNNIDAIDATSDMSMTDRLKQGVRASLRTGGGILGGAAGAAGGSLAMPVLGTAAGGVAGGYAGYKAGEALGNFLVGPERNKALRGGEAQPDQTGSIPANQGPAVDPRAQFQNEAFSADGNIWQQNKQGTDGSTKPAFVPVGNPELGPQQTKQFEVPRGGILISNNETGEVRAHGNTNPERAIMNEHERIRAANDAENEMRLAYGRGTGGLRGGAKPGGPFGDMARVMAYGAAGREAKNTAEIGLKNQANQLSLRKANAELGMKDRELNIKEAEFGAAREKAGREQFDKDIETRVMGDPSYVKPRDTGTFGVGGEKETDYKDRQARAINSLKSDIQFTTANRGLNYGKMSEPQRQQMFLAARMKQRVNEGRSDIAQMGRDFFGIKRFDSQDLLSYMPRVSKDGKLEGAETTLVPFQGGYTLRSQNGNTMTAKRGQGGEWNLTGPNGAIDADTAALFRPHIDALEKRLKDQGQKQGPKQSRGGDDYLDDIRNGVIRN